MKSGELIVNESFWKLFSSDKLKSQNFIIPDKIIFPTNKPLSELTRDIGITLQSIDSNKAAKYGIEIKTNGSSRSARIPLVRYSKENQTIWKFVKDIKSVDKGIGDLEQLEYYLNESLHGRYLPLPRKVLVLLEKESNYDSDLKNSEYLKKKSIESETIVLSLDFIEGVAIAQGRLDFEKLFSKKGGAIYTLNPLNGSNN